ncbi:MAG: ATP-binding cassette domain-containing protein [Nitrospiraceae bacterium]|nr:ATP-binding cassette domain-containing protein [Nitrospiraceae bacterium]
MDCPVQFEGVYKEYPYYRHMTAGFKSFLFNLYRNIESLKKGRFVALTDVSFEVNKGETFGIIGRNGSGKSTILGLIAGVIRQDRGFIRTKGKISSLLELGAGFHPDLSGVENIILNGVLMGNTREEMLGKMEQIIDFSELGDFIYQPLRTYSSGMHVRLGFSVAVHIDPEILLVDEALAVGDLAFQEKCLRRMAAFRDSGATTIMVSHDIASIVKLCDRVAWIENGTIMAMGKPREVVIRYIRHCGQPVPAAFEEELVEKEEKEPEVSDIPATIEEAPEQDPPEDQVVEQEPCPPPPLPAWVFDSWWDSRVVMAHAEGIITGSRDLDFYSYLQKEFMISALQRGVSIRTRLQGIEDNFVTYGVCGAFDVIGEPERITGIFEGTERLPDSSYDIVLCIDLMHRFHEPGRFLREVSRRLRDGGIVIAMEYIGPVGFRWPEDAGAAAARIAEGFDSVFGRHSDQADEPLPSGPAGGISPHLILPAFERSFEVLAVRPFGGPLHDLLLDRLVGLLDHHNISDVALIRTILQSQQVLIDQGVLDYSHAMILARKR